MEGQAIQSGQGQIFARYEKASLAGSPSALRGALTDSGDLEVQLDLTIPGPMDKAKVESLCESLPNLVNGTYSSRLRIITRTHPESDSPEGRRGSMITPIDSTSLDFLTRPQPRLPQLKEWLFKEV